MTRRTNRFGRARTHAAGRVAAGLLLGWALAATVSAQDPFDRPETVPPAEPTPEAARDVLEAAADDPAASPTPAQTTGVDSVAPALVAEPRPIETLRLLTAKVGAGRLVTMPASVERVALADESIARVQIISDREVLLTGLEPGQTTLYVWLRNGRRLKHLFQIGWDLELLDRMLRKLDPDIRVETSIDGEAIVLVGSVDNADVARLARERAQQLLQAEGARTMRIIDLLDHPDPDFSSDDRLAAALRQVDPRIQARRLQVGPEPDPAVDTYILEGRVRDVSTLVQALTLAERQLGGTGIGVVPVEGRQDFVGGRGHAARGYQGASGVSNPDRLGGHDLANLGGRRAPAGLAAEVSRGLVMMTQSGRVISFLEVDSLPQILVSIRILEIDRGKAKRVGVNFRLDTKDYSIGSFTGPQAGEFPELRGQAPTITDIVGGNLAVAFVDKLTAITAAIDFLEDQQLARSVAEPNVLTLTGEQASVVIGGEVPVPTTTVSDATALQGFFFEEFGIRLDIRPTVDTNGVITLEVSSSIRRPTIELGISGVPGFTLQSVQTSARVYTGQSLVIGGLLDFQETLEERRLPLLGKFPLFRWRRKSRGDSELVFLISPRLVEIDPGETTPPGTYEPPVETVDATRLRLPSLHWPGERDDWRNAFEPQSLTTDGVPPSFVPDEDPSDENARATAPRQKVDPATTNPATNGAGDPPALDAEHSESREVAEAAATNGSATPATGLAPAREPWVVREIADPCLNVRQEPMLEARAFECLSPGTLVHVVAERGGWMRAILDDGREGWLAGIFVAPTGGAADGATGDDPP